MVFKRKIYDKLKQWKELSGGSSAVLLEGARRIGKSTIVEEFAKNEYDDYMILDFAKEGKTPLFFAKEQKLLGMIAVADVIKEDSPQAVKELQNMGIRVVMLTGDNEPTGISGSTNLGS